MTAFLRDEWGLNAILADGDTDEKEPRATTATMPSMRRSSRLTDAPPSNC